MIKAILFDLDGTLIKDKEVTDYAFIQVTAILRNYRKINEDNFKETVKSVAKSIWKTSPHHLIDPDIDHDEIEGLWANYSTGEGLTIKTLNEWSYEYRVKTWTEVLNLLEIYEQDLVIRCMDQFINARQNYELYPDSKSILEELSKSFKLGLITNGVSILQRQKVRGSNIGHFFDEIVVSGEVNSHKPDSKIFHHICKQLNVKPHECVMIGDNVVKDIKAAKTINMSTILINRNVEESTSMEACEDADFICSGLNEIKVWLKDCIDINIGGKTCTIP